jgi:hypothetical protein
MAVATEPRPSDRAPGREPKLGGRRARAAPPAGYMMRQSGVHPGSTKGLTIMTLPITGLALALSVSLAASVATQAAAQPTPLLPPTIGNSATDAAFVATAPDADARAFLLSARFAIERGRRQGCSCWRPRHWRPGRQTPGRASS